MISGRATAVLLGLAVALALVGGAVHGPITPHFSSWLNSHGLSGDNFERADYGTQGSFGGKQSDADVVTKTPVVFVHGNSDTALKNPAPEASGWDNSIEYFQAHGYTAAELYATSWGDDNTANAQNRTHNCAVVGRLRRFIEAVKNYTGAAKVSLITHSMGVTLARKAVKGGPINGPDGNCVVGFPLKFVDVFVGLSGTNYGICYCQGFRNNATYGGCNADNGFAPGDTCGLNTVCGATPPLPHPCNDPAYATYLRLLNEDPSVEGKQVISAWSQADDLIQNGDYVWGRPTSHIPRSTAEKTYTNYTHMQTKEMTAEDQYNWVTSASG